jgi:hypothetical protein
MYVVVLNIGALRVGWSTPSPGRLIRKKEHRDSFTGGGGWLGPRASMNECGKEEIFFSLRDSVPSPFILY